MTALKDKLLETLPPPPAYFTRHELALAIGRSKGKLTQYDLQLLSELASEGKITIGEKVQVVQRTYTYTRKENGNEGHSDTE